MKTRWSISLLILLAFVFAACQPASPTPLPTEPAAAAHVTQRATAPQTEDKEAYPAPETVPETTPSEQDAYPEPDLAQAQPQENSGILYPGSKDGDEVSWVQAYAMIMNGEVKQVIQAHSLQVNLLLKDGRTLITREVSIDDVMKVIEQCGEPCKDTVIVTE